MGLDFAILGALLALGQSSREPWDTMADTWSGVDGLGREMPGFDQVGAPRNDRFVGVFFFLWHGSHINGGPYDITKILAADPQAISSAASPPWGPYNVMHHWGQSAFGYYLTDDEYVLRRQAQMLADAGVDVIIFDVTNQFLYKPYYRKLLDVFGEIRAVGGKTPQIAFLTSFGKPDEEVATLYRELYSPRIHPELWFRWRGKPLILADPQLLGNHQPPGVAKFFTFRKPQPDYFQGPTGLNQWSWLEAFPQHVFRDDRGRAEQMSVGVAQNAVKGALGSMSQPGAQGRNWHDGVEDALPFAVNRGYNFQEQANRALAQDPEFVFITGWNEWIAGRYPEFNGYRGPTIFVDEFNEEFSRDIEPMAGGHGDDYYYQMVDFIRRFKGVRPLPESSPSTSIRIGGPFSQWSDIQPEYRDDIGDAAHRDHDGWNGLHYVNQSGRNDFVAMKIARDEKKLYFYVRTRDPITPPPAENSLSRENWMNLLIRINPAKGPDWEGYSFIVNRTVRDGRTTVLERSAGGWSWTPAADIPYRIAGSEMQLAIPRAALGLEDNGQPLDIEFKWTDGMTHPGNIADFVTDGDVAPNGRFRYVYRTPFDAR